MLHKIYGHADGEAQERRYSPAVCTGTEEAVIRGDPDPAKISTSYVERQNLTMRMGMRRFTRLTNGFSKKVENLAHAVALHFMHYNFGRTHQTLKMTPAMAAGVADHVGRWTRSRRCSTDLLPFQLTTPLPRSDQRTAPPPVEPAPPRDEPAPPKPRISSDERLIQAWIAALQLEDYKRAASFFARGAIVDQGFPDRLKTRADAIEFNRSLPCRAEVRDVEDEGRTTLATFQLYDGPGGPCTGSVRVRFTILHRRFEVFRQLPDSPADDTPVPGVEA